MDGIPESATPEEEVEWYLDTWRFGVDPIDGDDERHAAIARIYRKMQDDPERYFSLLLSALEGTADSNVEAAATWTLADPQLVPLFGHGRVRGILRKYITGERQAIPSGNDWTALNAAVASYKNVASSDDARDLLPLVSSENSLLASSALETIAAIGDLSIVPEVKEAAGDRFQARYIEDVIGSIRKRHAQAEARPQGKAVAPNPDPLASEKTDMASASDSAAPPAVASTEQPADTSWVFWVLPVVLGMLAIYLTGVRRRKHN